MHQAGNLGSLAENDGMFFNGMASVVHHDTT
jgi:hypothetical protein